MYCLNQQSNIMNSTERLSQIKCFLLDMDGTFFLGNRLIEGALHFTDVLKSQGKDFLFLTNNSSKSRRQHSEKIASLGMPISEDKIFSSGQATALYLQGICPGARLFVVGTPPLQEEFCCQGFQLAEEDPEYLVLGFDTTLTYNKLWKLCDFVRAGLPYIATHADLNCPTETGFMPDAGAMIAFVKASTGREPDIVIGKPNRLIVDAAAARLGLPIHQLGMIGDRLYTDIALGQTSGITTVLVLSGETQLKDLETSPFQPDYIFDDLGKVADWLTNHNQPIKGFSC